MQYLPFCAWFISLSITSSNSTLVVASFRIMLFLKTECHSMVGKDICVAVKIPLEMPISQMIPYSTFLPMHTLGAGWNPDIHIEDLD